MMSAGAHHDVATHENLTAPVRPPLAKPTRPMHPLQRLLVLGLNHLLQRGLVSLKSAEDEIGHIFIEIAGRPSALNWRDIGCGELRLSVWFNLNMSRHPQARKAGEYGERFLTASPLAKREHYPEFVGATVSCYFARDKGPRLQGIAGKPFFQTYVRRDERRILEAIPEPVPMGFVVSGSSRA